MSHCSHCTACIHHTNPKGQVLLVSALLCIAITPRQVLGLADASAAYEPGPGAASVPVVSV